MPKNLRMPSYIFAEFKPACLTHSPTEPLRKKVINGKKYSAYEPINN